VLDIAASYQFFETKDQLSFADADHLCQLGSIIVAVVECQQSNRCAFSIQSEPGIANQFGLAYFSNSLITYIERFKTLAVGHGLEISINNRAITFTDEKIIESEAVAPYCYAGTLGSVSYKIIAGVAPKGEPEKAGWYIYCNGRLVVFADKTSLSGWGEDGIRNYHPSLAFFRGFVFFESISPDDLPWNTAKTGIDTSSKCYIVAKFRMKDGTSFFG